MIVEQDSSRGIAHILPCMDRSETSPCPLAVGVSPGTAGYFVSVWVFFFWFGFVFPFHVLV